MTPHAGMPPVAAMVALAATLLIVALGACTAYQAPEPDRATSGRSAAPPASPTVSRSPTPPPSTTPTPEEPPADSPRPERFREDLALRTVRHLALRIGPRHATSPAFAEAVRWTSSRLRDLGYDVRRQPVQVPGGVSWGVPVSRGVSHNVVATTPRFDPTAPYLLVGAHLDTVPPAPGAEDNASGVSVVLELARLATSEGTRLPVVFVLFGAEEPRGSGDDLHHFGSTAYVERLSPVERSNLVAMVSLDRVGVGQAVPVCTGGLSPLVVQQQLVGAAAAVDVATTRCTDNQSSDHWSFEKAGVAVARIGSTPYAAYHGAADLPGVVSESQLRRVGTTMWRWLTG